MIKNLRGTQKIKSKYSINGCSVLDAKYSGQNSIYSGAILYLDDNNQIGLSVNIVNQIRIDAIYATDKETLGQMLYGALLFALEHNSTKLYYAGELKEFFLGELLRSGFKEKQKEYDQKLHYLEYTILPSRNDMERRMVNEI